MNGSIELLRKTRQRSELLPMLGFRKFCAVLRFSSLIVAGGVPLARGASGLFPKTPQATNVWVVNCLKSSSDAKTAAFALQGLVNQTSAEVYVISDGRHAEQLKSSLKPVTWLTNLHGEDSGLRNLFDRYQSHVKQMFVYDPQEDWTARLALMASAQQDGLPVTATLRSNLMAEFHWTGKVTDFRGRWTNRVEAYDWALTNLMPQCSDRVLFTLHNGMRLSDYVVATRGFDFFLNRDRPEERQELTKILNARNWGLGSSLMGYAGDAINACINPLGMGYVVSDYYGNGSFWCSFSNHVYNQSPGAAIPAQKGKIYVSLMWSDGDNIQFDQNALYGFWHDSARGKIPVATSLSATLQELNPPLLDWYYNRRTDNDELMAGPAGVQFIYIPNFSEKLFRAWCEMTRSWCADAGFHTVRSWRLPKGGFRYQLYTNICGFSGIIDDWQNIKSYPPQLANHTVKTEKQFEENLASLKPDPAAPRFDCYNLIAQGFDHKHGGFSAIKRIVEQVQQQYPDRYVFQLPKDQFATIAAHYHLSAPPTKR
jgi:hypothetical protein